MHLQAVNIPRQHLLCVHRCFKVPHNRAHISRQKKRTATHFQLENITQIKICFSRNTEKFFKFKVMLSTYVVDPRNNVLVI